MSIASGAISQDLTKSEVDDLPDPKVSFLKSMVLPGWGHYYVDESNWTRGQYHIAAEVGLILSYIGLSVHTNNLRQNWFSYGRQEAGVPIEGRSRSFQLAVGDFNSLEAYNDYQLRSRNWDQLFADTPENRWNWQNGEDRNQYNHLRRRFETIDNQLPALFALMVMNRIISAISAYNRASKQRKQFVDKLSISSFGMGQGVLLNLRYRF
jgi:hypothetical protein